MYDLRRYSWFQLQGTRRSDPKGSLSKSALRPARRVCYQGSQSQNEPFRFGPQPASEKVSPSNEPVRGERPRLTNGPACGQSDKRTPWSKTPGLVVGDGAPRPMP